MKKPVVDWGFSCGRCYLTVNGFVVAMEGDTLRDYDLAEVGEKLLRKKYKGDGNEKIVLQSYQLDEGGLKVWTTELIKHVAAEANDGVLPT